MAALDYKIQAHELYDEPEERNECGHRLKALLTTIVLGGLVVLYMVMGVYLFQWLEGAGENAQQAADVQFANDMEAWKTQMTQTIWNAQNSPTYNATVAALVQQWLANISAGIQVYNYQGQVVA